MDVKLMYKQIDEYGYPIMGEQPERKVLGNRNAKNVYFVGEVQMKYHLKKKHMLSQQH
ncbi:hypothetical protein ACWFN4_22465 [Bacillus mycoides]